MTRPDAYQLLPTDGVDALGESPWWDVATATLWWVDIVGRRIRRSTLDGAEDPAIETASEVAFAIPSSDGGLAAGLSGSLEALTPVGAQSLWTAPFDPSVLRLNEGKTDRAGRLWFGSMHRAETTPAGCLYRWDGGPVTTHQDGLLVSNGLGWSPDGATMYFTDSPAGVIWTFDYDADTGYPRGRRVFVADTGPGFPDGLTVDEEGCVWSARWNGHRLLRYTPSGRIDREVAMPVAKPTSVAFAGADLATLVVTSARRDEGDGDLAGRVFLIDVGVRGVAEVPCRQDPR